VTVSGAARCGGFCTPSATLRAEVGDFLVIDEAGPAGIPCIGEIIGVPSPDGSPPYRVRWLAGEYESTILPAPGARIEKRYPPRRQGTPDSELAGVQIPPTSTQF
jgi:Domain of unknown function (DUF1918)